MHEEVFRALLEAQAARRRCCLATVVQTKGSAPREPGARMLVVERAGLVGTIGGGKMEAMVIDACRQALESGAPALKSFVLRENEEDSFGAVCGGEMTVFIEPQMLGEAICVVGGGHCARAILQGARSCGFHVTVVEDRRDELALCTSAHAQVSDMAAPDYILQRTWCSNDAVVLVSRNYALDRDALGAALQKPEIPYIGMIGSRRKVRKVFDELRQNGVAEAALARVYAPVGLDIGADTPEEIAISVMAEVLQVLRGAKGGHLKMTNAE